VLPLEKIAEEIALMVRQEFNHSTKRLAE